MVSTPIDINDLKKVKNPLAVKPETSKVDKTEKVLKTVNNFASEMNKFMKEFNKLIGTASDIKDTLKEKGLNILPKGLFGKGEPEGTQHPPPVIKKGKGDEYAPAIKPTPTPNADKSLKPNTATVISNDRDKLINVITEFCLYIRKSKYWNKLEEAPAYDCFGEIIIKVSQEFKKQESKLRIVTGANAIRYLEKNKGEVVDKVLGYIK